VNLTVNVHVDEAAKALGQLLLCLKSEPTSEIEDMLTLVEPVLTRVKLFWLPVPIN
jgi:hypothetical protein